MAGDLNMDSLCVSEFPVPWRHKILQQSIMLIAVTRSKTDSVVKGIVLMTLGNSSQTTTEYSDLRGNKRFNILLGNMANQ